MLGALGPPRLITNVKHMTLVVIADEDSFVKTLASEHADVLISCGDIADQVILQTITTALGLSPPPSLTCIFGQRFAAVWCSAVSAAPGGTSHAAIFFTTMRRSAVWWRHSRPLMCSSPTIRRDTSTTETTRFI